MFTPLVLAYLSYSLAVAAAFMLLAWLTSRWVAGVQIGLALVIVGIGLVLTTNAARLVATLR